MHPQTSVRKPCPWRVDQDARDIPGFSLEKAEGLRETCEPGQESGTPMFACHQSRPGKEIPCAGWVATYGHLSVAVRIQVFTGVISAEALHPGEDWSLLHGTFDEVICKLRATTPTRVGYTDRLGVLRPNDTASPAQTERAT